MRILINSYACCPNMGSEPGMGWHWIVSLAQYCKCHVISEGEFRPQVEQWMALPENCKLAQSLHFYWLPIGGDNSEKSACIRRMCWNQGDWRFYFYYRKWQKRAADCARGIVDAQRNDGKPIQILHQLNMIGFREPGYLWKVSEENDIPLVWGPINAKDGFPMAYAKTALFKQKIFLGIKNTITKFQLLFSPRVHRMAKRANIIISASTDAQQCIAKYWHKQSVCINETGCPNPSTQVAYNPHSLVENKEQFDILWCGRFLFSKQLDLAIKAVAESKIPHAVLHVLGSGDDKIYRQLAEQLGVNVAWHGQVSHDEVQSMMRQMDVLLFTSVFEGTPHVVLEAISNQLPVICHKSCGQGDVVNGHVGLSCPISTPEDSIVNFARQLKYLYLHPEMIARMKNNCYTRANELTWDNKARQMVNLYRYNT